MCSGNGLETHCRSNAHSTEQSHSLQDSVHEYLGCGTWHSRSGWRHSVFLCYREGPEPEDLDEGFPAAVSNDRIFFHIFTFPLPGSHVQHPRDGHLPRERTAIWDAVAVYIQNKLLLHQGVRIPTLGSFDVVPVKTSDEALVISRPVFCLARNLVRAHGRMDDAEYLPGHKEYELVQYTTVAETASVSWEEAESCVRGITSLMAHCLKKGENVTLVLKDVGVLLIEGTRVQMKFYYAFLERLCGKENLEKAVFKIPQLMDMIVSPVAAMSSLTFSGRVIIFPEYVMETMPKPPPRKPIKESGKESLPSLGQQEKDKTAAGSFPKHLHRTHDTTENRDLQPQDTMVKERWKAPFSHLPAVPGTSSTKKQPGSRKIQAAKPQKFREGRGKKTAPHDGGRPGTAKAMPSHQCGAPALSPEHNYSMFRVQPPRAETSPLLNSRPEKFWSVLQQPQKTILSGYNFNISCLCPIPYEASGSMQHCIPRAGLLSPGRPMPL
ncbi:uncharacterized protein [Excalfactoria chinensis]|uniref:uncharacterized protein n=1 Tax=Excalfactoria chinensis TaxID=46218 RepID=UPI003B3B333A